MDRTYRYCAGGVSQAVAACSHACARVCIAKCILLGKYMYALYDGDRLDG